MLKSSFSVAECDRIHIEEVKRIVKSKSVVISFKGNVLPENDVYFGYRILPVKLYVQSQVGVSSASDLGTWRVHVE